jgi:hypothetical protein
MALATGKNTRRKRSMFNHSTGHHNCRQTGQSN